jgi:proline iminopeptidase
MWGPSEFYATGTLKDYDRTSRLGELEVPVLLTAGRYDEATPETTAWYRSLIPGAELVIFENSAHATMLDEAERYVEVLRGFLRKVESR